MMRLLRGIARVIFILVVVLALGIGGFIGLTLAHFGRGLPDYRELANYVPAVGSKVYAANGSLMTEFETEHRIPVSIGRVPQMVIRAFLAAEDHDFYQHRGVDPSAIFRAALSDVLRVQRGQRPIGASTITQQVVRHFLLTNEVSISRKIKEALLAYRIEGTLNKNRILEIYLNEIYLGSGSYGVAAAADTYFQKPLDQLTLAEAAFLAALPKAPNNYNPIRHPAAAKARRDWVIGGMAELGWITDAQAKAAIAEPLGIHLRPEPQADQASDESGYFTEEVRRELVARFGEKAVYEGGLSVRTSYSASYQRMAEAAFRKGLIAYDERHGWRGPLEHLPTGAAALAALPGIADPPGLDNWQLAAVTAIDHSGATIALKGGGIGRLPLDDLHWARRTLSDQRVGAGVRRVSDVLNPGDIVLVEPLGGDGAAIRGRHAPAYAVSRFALRQIPNVSGGIVVMEPQTGRIDAMVGGWSFRGSQFNRVTQAMRQPGSAFKPLVYVTALEKGFTPWTTVDDEPVDIPQGPGLPAWQPVNYEGGYVGPTTLEDALVHSRNLATVHVAMTIGLPAIAKTAKEFGVLDKMPLYYSMALGAGETTLLRLTTAYSMLDNGGHWLMSSVIDLVQDRNGHILYQKGVNGCAACFVSGGPHLGSDAGTLYRASGPADPSTIYLPHATYVPGAMVYKPTVGDPLVSQAADTDIVSMMQGVVQHGTGIAVAAVGKPLAGKTGTTSNWFDAWFIGFSPKLAAGVFVGFDEPRTLGGGEVGGQVSAPIFRDFMTAALKDQPAIPFPEPAHAAPGPVVASATDDTDDGSGGAERDAEQQQWSSYAEAPPQAYPRPSYTGAAPQAYPGPSYAEAPPQAYPGTWGPYPAPPASAPPASAYAPAPSGSYGAVAAAPPERQYYAAPPTGYGFALPTAPAYPAAGWAGRPARGTGGLY